MQTKDLVIVELSPKLNATLVIDDKGLSLIRDFFRRVDTFCYDVETNVVSDFTQRKLRTVQVGNKDEQYVIDLLAFAGSTTSLLSGQGGYTAGEWAKPIVDTLREGLESKAHLKVGVYLQFDYEAIKWAFGLRPRHLYDCELVEKIIYCGRVNLFQKDFWGMDDMLLRYAGLKLNKTLQTSFDLCTPLTQDQVEYASLDVRLPLAIRGAQLPVLKKDGLERCVKFENNAIPAFGDMHLNGFYLDKPDWLAQVDNNLTKHEHNVKVLDTYFKPVVGGKERPSIALEEIEAKWRNEDNKETRAEYRKDYQKARKKLADWDRDVLKWEGEAAINYGSNVQVLAALHQMEYTAKQLPNTNDVLLKTFATEGSSVPADKCKHPVIRALQNYRETDKIKTGYGAEYPDKYINPTTGRVHSKINQMGAATGRTSASAPNVQNIMKGSAWRSCFKPRPGYKMVTVDMSGAELRIMAELSGEQSWITAFEKDWDVHSMGAEMMYGDRWADGAEDKCKFNLAHKKCGCKVHKFLRDYCKATNFKVAYGGADLSANLNISKKESDELLKLWRIANPTLDKYLQDSGKMASVKLESRTFSGRRRLYDKPTWDKAKIIAMERFEEDGKNPLTITSENIRRAYQSMFSRIERQGKNTPIQGGNIDIAKESVGCGEDKDGCSYLWEDLEPKYQSYLVSFVHDEVVIEAPEDKAQKVLNFVKDCIKRAGAEFMTKVTMESEGAIADCWFKE